MNKLLVALFASAVVAVPAVASASSPAAVFGDIEKVVFEPNADDPDTATRVAIYGVFAKSNGATPPVYQPAKRGFFYYACPAGQLATCRMEWKEIKRAVGTPDCAGWGDSTKDGGTIHAWCDARPATAQPYPIYMGVQLTLYAAGTCSLAKAVADPAACTTDAGTDASSDAGAPEKDSGTPQKDSGTTEKDSGTPVATDSGTTTDKDAGTPPPKGSEPTAAQPADSSGCSMGANPSSMAPFAAVPFALVALSAITRRKRR